MTEQVTGPDEPDRAIPDADEDARLVEGEGTDGTGPNESRQHPDSAEEDDADRFDAG